MRRSASEVIRDLEMRVARLEKQSGIFDIFTGKIDLNEIVKLLQLKHKTANITKKGSEIHLSFIMGNTNLHFVGSLTRNSGKVRLSSLSNILLFRKLKEKGYSEQSLSDPSLIVIEFKPDYEKMGLDSSLHSVESMYIYIDSYDKVILRSDFSEKIKFKPMVLRLKSMINDQKRR